MSIPNFPLFASSERKLFFLTSRVYPFLFIASSSLGTGGIAPVGVAVASNNGNDVPCSITYIQKQVKWLIFFSPWNPVFRLSKFADWAIGDWKRQKMAQRVRNYSAFLVHASSLLLDGSRYGQKSGRTPHRITQAGFTRSRQFSTVRFE